MLTRIAILLLAAPLLLAGCKKFLKTDLDVSKVSGEDVFNNEVSAKAALSGLYESTRSNSILKGGYAGLAVYGMTADELESAGNWEESLVFQQNRVKPDAMGNNVQQQWDGSYKTIYAANDIIRALSTSTGVPEALRNQIRGEAYFIRALMHFYMTITFGEVPIVLSIDYKTNQHLPRSPVKDVFQQVIADLLQARELVSEAYPADFRIRANKATVDALLARVYLYTHDWEKALERSNNLIANPEYDLEDDLNLAFLKGSKETIFQLSSDTYYNTADGMLFNITEVPGITSDKFLLRPSLLSLFDADDKRLRYWVDTFTVGAANFIFPYKYKAWEYYAPLTEFTIVFRLVEQYLIRAEARANTGDMEGAEDDINEIRRRAGVDEISIATKDEAMAAIELERRLELFSEGGHRWYDLKRWKRADAVLGPIKAPNWQSNDTLMPIPLSEMEKTSWKQNAGY